MEGGSTLLADTYDYDAYGNLLTAMARPPTTTASPANNGTRTWGCIISGHGITSRIW